MSDLPFELIDYILTFVDASSLYELAHVSHALSQLSQKQIYHNHIQYASLRLWMHQPGTMIHRPIVFDLQITPTPANRSDNATVEFIYTGEPIPFDSTKPVSVDGCTIIFDQHQPGPNQHSAKKHYGITYDDQPIVMNNIDCTWTMGKQDQWSMRGELDQEGRFQPLNLSCNVNLFNPGLLDTLLEQQTIRLKQRIQFKKQQQQQQRKTTHGNTKTTTLFDGLTTLSKDHSAPKSLDILAPTPPSKHFAASPITSVSL